MAKTLNTPETFPEECTLSEMANSEICTRQCGVKEFCSWQTLEPRMLGKMNGIMD